MKTKLYFPVLASSLVSIFLLGGVAGTYIGASLSDKLGARTIMLGSVLLSVPAIALVNYVTSPWAAILAVLVAGTFIIGSFATTIIVAQTMMPNKVGMASGLTIGFSVGLGGLGVTVLGAVADSYGLELVMESFLLLPLAAAVAVLGIPFPKSLLR